MEGGRDPKLIDLIAVWIEKLAKIISFFYMFSFYTIIKINIDCWGSIDCRGRCRWQRLHDLHRYLLCTEPLICMRMWFHPPQCFWLFACLIAALPKLKVPVIISKIWNEGLRAPLCITFCVWGHQWPWRTAPASSPELNLPSGILVTLQGVETLCTHFCVSASQLGTCILPHCCWLTCWYWNSKGTHAYLTPIHHFDFD